MLLALVPATAGASSATITVNAASALTTFKPVQFFGINTVVLNAPADYNATQTLVQAAGNRLLRYPGGSYADLFHWNGTGSSSAGVWVPDATTFTPGFMAVPQDGGAQMLDGNTLTAWTSNADTDFPASQSAYFSFSSQQTVTGVTVQWGTPFAATFVVQYWDPTAANQWGPYNEPASHWLNTSAGVQTGAGGTQTVTFNPVSTNYVRLLLTSSSAGPSGAYSIEEVSAADGGTKLAISAATVSSALPTSAPDPTYAARLDFESFMAYARSFNPSGIPLITVNFGTGTPQEAAAWVHYANVVRGYGIKYWEIGNEINGNWEAGGPLRAEDYARRFIEFHDAMTAVDPSIVLLGPALSGVTENSEDYDGQDYIHNLAQRLISAGDAADLGGVSFHQYGGFQDNSDTDLLASSTQWPSYAATLNANTAGLSPSLPVFLTEYNGDGSVTGSSTMMRLVDGLWMVDWVGQYLKAFGPRANATFMCLFNGGGLYDSTAGDPGYLQVDPGAYQYQPRADYWAMQMMACDWAIPADARDHQLVSCSSTLAGLPAWADLRPDGVLALAVCNQDPSNAVAGTLQIAGFAAQPSAVTYSFGPSQYAWSTASAPYHAAPDTAPVQSVLAGVGPSFGYSFPPYSITVFQFQPAGTPTPSPTTTPSLSATPTPLPVPTDCASTVLYNGESGAGNRDLATGGTWASPTGANGNTTITEDAAAAYQGAAGMDLHLNWLNNSAWSGGGWNFANWSTSNAVDAGADNTLELWIRSPSGDINYLYVALVDAAAATCKVAVNSYLPAGVDAAWQRLQIPLSAFTGVNLHALMELDINIQNIDNGDLHVYVDNVALVVVCPSSSATPSASATAVASRTATATATPSATPSGTATATASSSPTGSPSPSPSCSPTGTRTASPSPSATPTGSDTSVPTASTTLSPTGTATAVPPGSTSTATPSASPVFSATATVCPTPTGTWTGSGTPSPSAVPSATVTVPASATETCSPTSTPMSTITPASTSAPAASGTASATASWTVLATDTPAPTGAPSLVPSSTSTPRVPSVTATRTVTASVLESPTPTPAPSSAATVGGTGSVDIAAVVPVPNPNAVVVDVLLEGAVDGVTLRIFSEAMNLEQTVDTGPLAAGWNAIVLPPSWRGRRGYNGTYFVRASAWCGTRVSLPSPCARLVVVQ